MTSSRSFQPLEVEKRKEVAGLIGKRVAEATSHRLWAVGRAGKCVKGLEEAD